MKGLSIFFRRNNENIWIEIISLVDDVETKRKMNNYKKFSNSFQRHDIKSNSSSEDIIYHYNKDDEYINKALEIISK